MATKVTYEDWVEIKGILKDNRGSVSDTADDSDRSRETVRLVKKSKSYKQYKESVKK